MAEYNESMLFNENYFHHCLKIYQNWKFSWFRETIENSINSKATRIDFKIQSKGAPKRIELSVTDNGKGMDMASLKNALLTLGGTTKISVNNLTHLGIGKQVILLAHNNYFIHTRNFLVVGNGTHYSIEPADEYLNGTNIRVDINKTSSMASFSKQCRILVRQLQRDILITFNGKGLVKNNTQYQARLKTDLGICCYSKQKDSNVSLWIRKEGIPLFHFYCSAVKQIGLIGVLDLSKKSTDVLTASKDYFNSTGMTQLHQIVYVLIHKVNDISPYDLR